MASVYVCVELSGFDSRSICFNEAEVYLDGREGRSNHSNRIFFGEAERAGIWDKPYFVDIENLSEVFEKGLFSRFFYQKVDEVTEARRTLGGGVKIRRVRNLVPGISGSAVLSREECCFLREIWNRNVF